MLMGHKVSDLFDLVDTIKRYTKKSHDKMFCFFSIGITFVTSSVLNVKSLTKKYHISLCSVSTARLAPARCNVYHGWNAKLPLHLSTNSTLRPYAARCGSAVSPALLTGY